MPDLGEQESIFEHLRTGKINMKQAGNMLGIDTSMLAYQLAGKVNQTIFNHIVVTTEYDPLMPTLSTGQPLIHLEVNLVVNI